MIQQRIINMNPEPDRLEAWRITYPSGDKSAPRRRWLIEPMRFIPHDGRAKG